MATANTRPPSGMRDFLPGEIRGRRGVLGAVQGVFESYGFVPLETPAIERLEILQGKYGEEGDRLIFKVAQRGAKAGEEADLALRYDLTVPLARVVAEYQGRLGKVFKRYQIAPVWRADRPGKGRFREFNQCDVDTVGVGFGLADAETLLALTDCLVAVGLDSFEVRLNSRKVLHGLIEAFGIEPGLATGVLTALDKLDKIGWAAVLDELVADRGLPISTATPLADVIGDEARLRARLASSQTGRAGLDEVDTLMALVAPLMKGGRVSFTPSLARGLTYYTGPIFEIYVEGFPSAIASGGRYDGLVGMFAGREIPACGGSLGIERIIPLVARPAEVVVSPARVLVTVWDAAARPEALVTAAALRREGIPAEVYLAEDRTGEQLGYASSRGIPFALLCGPREREQGLVTVRDLRSREQVSLPAADLPALVAHLR
jgi:histidyl-tRNA synthetase